MDQSDLYDQFGNYMGPELESDEEDDDEQQNGYRHELNNVDQTSDMVKKPKDLFLFKRMNVLSRRKMIEMKLKAMMSLLICQICPQLLFYMKIRSIIQVL